MSRDRAAQLAIVVPVYNDEVALQRLLTQLARLRLDAPAPFMVIVVDGGSSDGSAAVARAAAVVDSFIQVQQPSRGDQLAAGAGASQGRWLWFVHADTRVPEAALHYLLQNLPRRAPGWGRFDIEFDQSPDAAEASPVVLNLVKWLMNWRSRHTGICTGDQGIFTHPRLLDIIGGVPRQPLMEDIELSRRLKACCWPDCPREHLGTSSRRWQSRGAIATMLSMWWWRLRYWLGENSAVLAAEYYGREYYGRE